MLRNLGFWAVLLLFALSSLAQSTLLIAVCVGLGIFVAGLCRISPYGLFLMSIPFVISLDTPIRLTLTISDFILPVVIVVLLWRMKNASSGQRSENIQALMPAAIWIAILLGIIALSSIQAELDLLDYIASTVKIVYAIVGGIAVVGIYLEHRKDREELDQLLRYFVMTSALVATLGIVAFFFLVFFGLDSGFIYGSARLQSTFDNPNAFASYGLISLPIALYYAYRRSSRYADVLCFLILVGIVLSNSRTGQLATISLLVLGYLIFVRTRRGLVSWSKFALPGLALTGGLIPLLSAISAFMDSIQGNAGVEQGPNANTPSANCEPGDENPGECEEATDETLPVRTGVEGDVRFTLWETAFRIWLDAPLLGRGFGQFLSASQDYRDSEIPLRVHNTFLSFLAETGVMGAVTFALPFVVLPILLLKMRSALPNSLTLAILTISVMMLALNLENSRSLWILVGLSYALVVSRGTARANVAKWFRVSDLFRLPRGISKGEVPR